MKVSVVVPVYRVEPYIRRCFASILVQTYTKLECIFIDDGSPDNCYSILKNLIADYCGPIELKLIKHEKNMGLSVARNTGTLAASGDYIFYLDSDDEISVNCIHNLVELALKYPGVEIVQGNTKTVPLQSNDWRNIRLKQFPEYVDDLKWIEKHCFSNPKIPVNSWNKLICKRFILNNNLYFYENIVHEDELWMFYVSRNLTRICFTGKVTYIHYINADSIMQSSNNYKKIYSFFKIIERLMGAGTEQLSGLERQYILKSLRSNMIKVNVANNEKELLSLYRNLAKKILVFSLRNFLIFDSLAVGIFLLPRFFYCSYFGKKLSKNIIKVVPFF